MILIRNFQNELQKRLEEKTSLIQVLIGPRQVGKTTAAQNIYEKWAGPKLMLTADSPTPPPTEWLAWNWEKAKILGPNTLLIIDEVQKIRNWSEQIKQLFDQERGKGNLKVVLLGSSSLYLQKGLHESLAGRFELLHVNHWSFAECNKYFGWDFDKYLKFGGYPGAATFITDEERWRSYILNGIIEPVLGKDILGQQSVANPALFRQTYDLVVRHPAQIVSFQKLLGQLQDRGNASTIKNYLTLFEKAFLIRQVPKYSGSEIRARTSSPKIVVLNPALINVYQTADRLDKDLTWYGYVFESVIAAHLALLPGCELFYWKKGQFEVDYVLKKRDETIAIEIKSGRPKNFSGLREFSKEYPKIRCEMWDYEECLKFIKEDH